VSPAVTSVVAGSGWPAVLPLKAYTVLANEVGGTRDQAWLVSCSLWPVGVVRSTTLIRSPAMVTLLSTRSPGSTNASPEATLPV